MARATGEDPKTASATPACGLASPGQRAVGHRTCDAPRGVRAILAWAIITAVNDHARPRRGSAQAEAATKTTHLHRHQRRLGYAASRSTSGKVLGQLAKGKHVLAAGTASSRAGCR